MKNVFTPAEKPPDSAESDTLEEIRQEISDADNPLDVAIPIERIAKALVQSGLVPDMSLAFAKNIVEEYKAQIEEDALTPYLVRVPKEPGLERLLAIRNHIQMAADRLCGAGVRVDFVMAAMDGVIADLRRRSHDARKKPEVEKAASDTDAPEN